MPADVVAKLNSEIRKIMSTPEMKAQFLTLGTDAATSSPEELGTLLGEEVAKIKRVAKSVGASTN
jgi:tripartite-type tricarboxylate transporter receptor subunit TctC